MIESEKGLKILKTQPRLNSIEIKKLLLLPNNTFGYKYANFMDRNNFKPEERPLTKYINDYDLAYIKQRYKEIHDFIHVILDLEEISILNEIKVKYFEMAHFGFPSCALSVFFGKFHLGFREIADLYSSCPDLAKKALNCEFLLNIDIENCFEDDFRQFLEKININ